MVVANLCIHRKRSMTSKSFYKLAPPFIPPKEKELEGKILCSFFEANNIPACIVAIDQSKAFDSISHKYMIEAYRFFGLGDQFINLLVTLGSGRNACLSFDDGTISAPFDLGRGRTQDNGPSPCEYNIGQQILLLKIELCPEIASVYNHLQVPRTVFGRYNAPHPSIIDAVNLENNSCFKSESRCETDKTEGFADDTSVATIFSPESLGSLKKILIENCVN